MITEHQETLKGQPFLNRSLPLTGNGCKCVLVRLNSPPFDFAARSAPCVPRHTPVFLSSCLCQNQAV